MKRGLPRRTQRRGGPSIMSTQHAGTASIPPAPVILVGAAPEDASAPALWLDRAPTPQHDEEEGADDSSARDGRASFEAMPWLARWRVRHAKIVAAAVAAATLLCFVAVVKSSMTHRARPHLAPRVAAAAAHAQEAEPTVKLAPVEEPPASLPALDQLQAATEKRSSQHALEQGK